MIVNSTMALISFATCICRLNNTLNCKIQNIEIIFELNWFDHGTPRPLTKEFKTEVK